MEGTRARKHRGVVRTSFTRLYKQVETYLKEQGTDSLYVAIEQLSNVYLQLKEADEKVYYLMLDDETIGETELDNERILCEEYEAKYLSVKKSVDKFTTAETQSIASGSQERSDRRMKLPVIKLKKFSGDVKEWLNFWNSFKKIHDDELLPVEDKFEYLYQSMEAGSRAEQVVRSVPQTSENYSMAIKALHSRFGREDIIIDVYIRELLGLVLQRHNRSEVLNLINLYDQLETQLRALETLGVMKEKYAALLYPLVESSLPEELLRTWQRNMKSEDMRNPEIKLKSLMSFLQAEVEGEERITLAMSGFEIKPKNKMPTVKVRTPTATSLYTKASVDKCLFCSEAHISSNCVKAKNMDLDQKRKRLMETGACFRCLNRNHRANRCKATLCCGVCKKKHVDVMCSDKVLKVDKNVEETSVPPATGNVLSNHVQNNVLLQTLVVNLSYNGKNVLVRALIDTGSQKSYVTKNLLQLMGEKIGEHTLQHTLFGGIQGNKEIHSVYKVHLNNLEGTYDCYLEVLDQDKICGYIPCIPNGAWLQEIRQRNIQLSDNGKISGDIQVLIGADVAGKLITGNHVLLKCGLAATETYLGWTLMGKVPGSHQSTTSTVISMFVNDVSDWWSLDTLGIYDPGEKQSRREAEETALAHFKKTVRRDTTGRYEVDLPWLEGHRPLPTNLNIAEKRLATTTRKLNDQGYRAGYDEVLLGWRKENIIEPAISSDKEGHFLPHRHVVKSYGTTKIRPVFDASAHLKFEPALNDCLEKGPNLIAKIPDILFQFRKNSIGVIADIKQAFLQIGLKESDRKFLKFLWWNNDGSRITYQHCRVVFGVSCSPFILGAVINYHLDKSRVDMPENKFLNLMKDGFYVDNLATSVQNQMELDLLMHEAKTVMTQACFDLRGWEWTIMDSKETLEDVLVLGLKWNKGTDQLGVNLELPRPIETVSKRYILSAAQKIFDPIGFTCPATLPPKLLLQDLWKRKIGWDEDVPLEIARGFQEWHQQVYKLTTIQIPRSLDFDHETSWSLHAFCDASQVAYAAVIFLRAECPIGVNIHFILAKTRIAPVKTVTIPRLELLAATVGARMIASVSNCLKQVPVIMWSDSSTVLSWINRDDPWSVFVFNRVQEIRQLTQKDSWYHVPGKMNPADLPSQGCSPEYLCKSRWWEGPAWLKNRDEWPIQEFCCDEEEILVERKRTVLSLYNVTTSDWIYRYFTSFQKILNMIAWMYRFTKNCSFAPYERILGTLTSDELDFAERRLLRVIQKESFSENDKLLRQLNGHQDEEGLWRLETKITKREDVESFLKPIILPSKHPLVLQLILAEHRKACHVGIQGLLCRLREKYWILGGRKTVKSALSQCLVCKKEKANNVEAVAASLPLDRVRDAVVFEIIGLDIAGPLYLRDSGKVWILLITCGVYRAVHLELATSLSTNVFLLAFRRFVARRGRPRVVYSDNGTNFVGARNALNDLDWNSISEYAATERITWKLNPPASPWWGGWWERLIRLLKQLLRRTLGNASLDYEELNTLLCDCEAVMNSRPLTYVSDDAEDLIPLTPAMFLQEIREVGVPDLDLISSKHLNKRIRYRQKLMEDIRHRFRSEYLGQLVHQAAQRPRAAPVGVGDVVLIGADNIKRINWPIGLVTELLPDDKGTVRLVRVKCGSNHLLRPVQRLYPLELRSAEVQEIRHKACPESVISEQAIDNQSSDATDETSDSSSGSEIPEFITRSGRRVKRPERLKYN